MSKVTGEEREVYTLMFLFKSARKPLMEKVQERWGNDA